MNILLVTIDCLRRDRCGIYGHHRNTTPTLDALAQEAHVFENAYATGPVTTESFPGILAGRLSAQTIAGSTIYQKCLPEGAETIASHLRDKGWSTTAVISNPRIGAHVGSDRGFDEFQNLRVPDGESTDDPSGSILPEFVRDISVGDKLYSLRERMREFEFVPYRYEIPFLGFRYYQYLSGWPSIRGEVVVNQLLDSLSEQSSPFFGWTHLMDIHGPLHPHAVTEGGLSKAGSLAQFRSHARRVSDVYDSQIESRYDSAVRYTDMQLGRIVDWLKSNKLWDETTLIVTADHGEALHDHGIYGHSHHYMYDELLSVPLVVHAPTRDSERLSRPFSLGWLHNIITDICEVGSLEAPLSSSYQWDVTADAVDSDETLLADSISSSGHSVVARRGAKKQVLQDIEMADLKQRASQQPGMYHTDYDPKERAWGGSEGDLYEYASEYIVSPEEIKPTASSGINRAAEDRLKQLGYAE